MATPPDSYHEVPLLTFVRGHRDLAPTAPLTLDEALQVAAAEPPLDVRKFRRKPRLPRVEWVLGRLNALRLKTVLDVGTGRGTALWPVLDASPSLKVGGTDRFEGRARDLEAMRRGGHPQILGGWACVAERLEGIADRSFEGAMALEVLEHTEDPLAAACELLRVADHVVLVTVPCDGDTNPDHRWLFTDPRYAPTRASKAQPYPLATLWEKAAYLTGRTVCEARIGTVPARRGSPHPEHFTVEIHLDSTETP